MKKRNNRIGFFGAVALALAGSLGGANQVNALPAPTHVVGQNNTKDALPVEQRSVRPMAVRNSHGGFSGEQNVFKHIRKGSMNQRQLRKFLRQNPTQRKKYGK